MLKPIDRQKWNFYTAAHLLNRAGFGGTPEEIEKLAALTPEAAVASLVNYEKFPDNTPNPEWAKPDPERMQRLAQLRMADEMTRRTMQQQEQQQERQRMIDLKYWWLDRMAKGPRPLQEKMTLFWHGHFATSMEKVRDAYLMWKQNDIFRRMATSNWLELLVAVSKDPAMLVWLDQAQSRPEHPNENFAREVMELFTLGEGHYTERDITEAARALTGWTYERPTQEFMYRPRLHDMGVKTFLGYTGYLNGDDVLRQIVSQPQASRYITARIWNFFVGEYPTAEMNGALAGVLLRNGGEFKPLLTMMFLGEEFYADKIVRNQVKSPVQWLVGSVKVLERDLPAPQICLNLTRNLGQDLFAPPNVKGWDGGLSWITTNNLLTRYNDSAVLVQGDPSALRGERAGDRADMMMARGRAMGPGRLRAVNVNKLFTPEERQDKDALIAALQKRLLQGQLKEKQQQALREYLDSQSSLGNAVIMNAIKLVMSTPEYQLT
jgi:uncharacterized protein (DUF1800 family)